MTDKYKSARLLADTYKLAKIEAAKQDIPIARLLDKAVKREIKYAERLRGEK